MNAPHERLPEADMHTYLYASANNGHVRWLTGALTPEGSVVAVAPDVRTLDEHISTLAPLAVFLDFSADQGATASLLHQRLKRDWPDLPVLGTGLASEPATMLAALRAGVDDFVDVLASPLDALRTLRTLMERQAGRQDGTRGCTVALLGARAGLGVTTLSTSLALALQTLRTRAAKAPAARASRHGVALLDLGLPARDGLLYLDTPSTFSFIDGVRNLRRLDQTLLHTALSHHSSGVAVLPLPASLGQVREISHAESVALIARLGDFFDFQLADLGGFSTTDFVAETARVADQAWIVCDQSLGGIVSTAALIKDLRTRGIEPERLSLVVNKFDSHVGLSARDIAERLGLPLRHVLPARATQLLAAASRGEMLVQTASGDAYSQAVTAMARSLHQEFMGGGKDAPARDPRWAALMSQLTGSWKRPRES